MNYCLLIFLYTSLAINLYFLRNSKKNLLSYTFCKVINLVCLARIRSKRLYYLSGFISLPNIHLLRFYNKYYYIKQFNVGID